MSLLMIVVFAVLLVLAFPVGYALVIASGAAVLTLGSGSLMMSGTLGQKLVKFAAALVLGLELDAEGPRPADDPRRA